VKPDLVLQEPSTGFIKIWNMSGHRVAAEEPFTRFAGGDRFPVGSPDGWRIVGTGDWR
jgi:hypothetical protein